MSTAARILPAGAFKLVKLLRPDLLDDANLAATLAGLFSPEVAVDDPHRRNDLLALLDPLKKQELETRLGCSLDMVVDELGTTQRRTILGFFGASTGREPSAPKHERPEQVAVRYGLFPHQKRAAAAIENYLYHDSGRAMLHLPTGVGKTRTAMSIVATHLRQREHGLVIWLASGRELLEQASEEFEQTWSAVGDRPLDCLRFWGSHDPAIDAVEDGMVVAGLSKLHAFSKDRDRLWSLGDRTTLVVFDEAHQSPANTYQDLVLSLVTRNPRTALLGLSATPGRTWSDIDADLEVSELFHRNKVTLDLGDADPIASLTADGYLARVNFSQLNVEPGFDLDSADIASLERDLELSAAVTEALGDDEQRNLRVIHRILELTKEHDRVLVFAATVRHALLVASVLRAIGVDSDAVTGNTEPSDRSRAIARFKRKGGKRVLVNYGVLTTGFDAPAASAAVIARPTKSLVLYSQMVGRVIRGPRAGGTESCDVVTVVDTNLAGFGNVAEAFTNWEDVWTTR